MTAPARASTAPTNRAITPGSLLRQPPRHPILASLLSPEWVDLCELLDTPLEGSGAGDGGLPSQYHYNCGRLPIPLRSLRRRRTSLFHSARVRAGHPGDRRPLRGPLRRCWDLRHRRRRRHPAGEGGPLSSTRIDGARAAGTADRDPAATSARPTFAIDGHHLVPWARGGATELDNLVQLKYDPVRVTRTARPHALSAVTSARRTGSRLPELLRS
jgi:hypothetical protein